MKISDEEKWKQAISVNLALRQEEISSKNHYHKLSENNYFAQIDFNFNTLIHNQPSVIKQFSFKITAKGIDYYKQ